MPKLLVVAESDGAKPLPATLPAVAFAQQWSELTGGVFDIVVLGGPDLGAGAAELTGFGAAQVRVAADSSLTHPVTERAAAVIVAAARAAGAEWVAGPATQYGRDVLPRAAALLDAPMLSDVTAMEAGATSLRFKRPMYAGNVIATVELAGGSGVFSIRLTAFGKPQPSGAESPIAPVALESTVSGAKFLALDAPEQKRPDLTAARVVVSGGRPLRDAETFERLLGGLADKLGGAVGATRAAVDAGIASNELQVGQTGKIVAPDLYIAAGVSGSVQHLAGMKESKVIVAINNDPEAPIFEIADYGLVADLHQALPELTSKL